MEIGMKQTYTLELNGAEWDHVADALLWWDNGDAYRRNRLLSKMHNQRTSASRVRAGKVEGYHPIFGIIRLLWEDEDGYERRKARLGPLAKGILEKRLADRVYTTGTGLARGNVAN